MSSRALRRLQQEQLLGDNENESDEETVEQRTVKKINPFDLLNTGEEEEEEKEEEEEEEEKEIEVPKKEEPKASSSKKKNKKGKKKTDDDLSMRELDKVLQEMNKKSKKSKKTNTENTETRRQLLSVNMRLLDAEAEMKRLFGSHVVNSENRSQGRQLKKSKFATPKPEWPPFKRNGLSMEFIETRDGVSEFGFRHSEAYQDGQLDFLNAVSTHDPNMLVSLTRKYPYHVDTLLQLSEVAKHSGDWVTAGDFIERALYACERALHPQFSLGSGNVRLSFKRSENRSFFLAIFRHIQFLARRGCWRTAFEFNKLLFALDPIQDPLGSLLSLDHFALVSRDYDYVLKMCQGWKTDGKMYPTDLLNMPNFAYSAAYAELKLNKNTKALQEAVDKFPLTQQLLLEKLDKPVENKKSSQVYLSAIQTVYAEKAYELFKEPEVLDWLVKHTAQTEVKFSTKDIKCEANGELPQNLARFLLLIDNQRLLSLVPSKYTDTSYHMYDPLPPHDSETMYDINDRLPRSTGVFPTDIGNLLNGLQRLWGERNQQLPADQMEQIRNLMHDLGQLQSATGQIPGAFPEDTEEVEEHSETEMPQTHAGDRMTAEEMAEIMNAVSDDELEMQRALEEAYQRR